MQYDTDVHVTCMYVMHNHRPPCLDVFNQSLELDYRKHALAYGTPTIRIQYDIKYFCVLSHCEPLVKVFSTKF